jgi:hypothetical protein
MIRSVGVAAGIALIPAAAFAQASPAPSPSPTPSAIGPAFGGNDPCTTLSAIVTRPTVTNAVCTVRPNHYEIEAGYQNTSFPGAGNTVVYPQGSIRVGTALRNLEFGVIAPQYTRTSLGGAITTGLTDAGAALKYVIGYSPKVVYGVQASFTAPTGDKAFSAGATQSLYALQAAYTISPVFSLAAGVQDQILATGGVQYGSFVPSLVLTASLPASTGVFAEVSQFTRALGPGSTTRTQYIGGVYHDFGQRLQVDVEYGFSPTVATGKYNYIGAGFGYYF